MNKTPTNDEIAEIAIEYRRLWDAWGDVRGGDDEDADDNAWSAMDTVRGRLNDALDARIAFELETQS